MANLLPPDVKKEIRREYLLRLAAVLSVHAVFAMLVIISFALSGFFDVRTNYLLVKAQSEKVQNAESSEEEKAVRKVFDDFRVQVDALATPVDRAAQSTDIIKVIMLGAGGDIHLRSFSFSNDPAGKRKLVVSGTSDTRDALVAFQKHLTENEMFDSVDLPVSNFSKKSDIAFTVTLGLTKQ